MANPSGKPGQWPTSVQKLMRNSSQNRRNGPQSSLQSSFGQILAHARVLDRLDHILACVLDTTLVSHCQVAEFRNQCLILVCSNASFATRIRMISQQLLDSFREEGVFGIERIEIRISPVNRPQPEVHKQRNLSPAAVQALGRFAADSGDAEIQAIFDKINARRNQ